jgi:excisionase family DNA binding protein
MTGRPLLTVQEAATELGITVRGVQERLKRGAMQGERVTPRLWLIPRDEVERWKVLGRQQPGRKPGQRSSQMSGEQR